LQQQKILVLRASCVFGSGNVLCRLAFFNRFFFFCNSMLLVLFVEKIEEMWGELVKCLS
jgi:preprotein translocase subunit SecG